MAMGRSTLTTSTGSQDVKTAATWTPKAGMYWLSNETADTSFKVSLRFTLGFYDGTRNRCIALRSRDNQVGTTSTNKSTSNSHCALMINNASTATAASAAATGFVAGGTTWNVDDAFPTAMRPSHMHFGGDNLEAKTGSFLTTNTTDSDVSETGVGFEPQVVIFATTASSDYTETVSVDALISVGFAAKAADGTITQGCLSWIDPDGVTTTDPGVVASRQYAGQAMAHSVGPTAEQAIDFKSFDSDGFTVTTRNDNTGIRYIYLALGDETNPLYGFVRDHTSKTNSEVTADGDGLKSITGVGFEAKGLIHLASMASAWETLYSNANAEPFGISGYSVEGDAEFADAIITDDNVGTTNTNNNQETAGGRVMFNSSGSPGNDVKWTTSSIDADGWTDNFSDTVGSAKRIVTLCIAHNVDLGVEATDLEKSTSTGSLDRDSLCSVSSREPVRSRGDAILAAECAASDRAAIGGFSGALVDLELLSRARHSGLAYSALHSALDVESTDAAMARFSVTAGKEALFYSELVPSIQDASAAELQLELEANGVEADIAQATVQMVMDIESDRANALLRTTGTLGLDVAVEGEVDARDIESSLSIGLLDLDIFATGTELHGDSELGTLGATREAIAKAIAKLRSQAGLLGDLSLDASDSEASVERGTLGLDVQVETAKGYDIEGAISWGALGLDILSSGVELHSASGVTGSLKITLDAIARAIAFIDGRAGQIPGSPDYVYLTARIEQLRSLRASLATLKGLSATVNASADVDAMIETEAAFIARVNQTMQRDAER